MAKRRIPPRGSAARRELVCDLLEERAETGVTYAELSRRTGIPAATFSWWQRRLSSAARPDRGPAAKPGSGPRRSGGPAIELVELAPITVAGNAGAFEIELPGGVMVRVPSRFDAEALKTLLGVLAGPC